MQPFRKHSSWWLGRAPQHPLSRTSSICGVDDSFCFDVMQIFNNVQMNGWSCFPKHGPAQFTALSQLFVRMAWNFSKIFEILAGSCFPKHGPSLFTVLQNLFDRMLCSRLNAIKLMAGPRSPTSLVTAQLNSRCRRIFSFRCDADYQQRLNERLVVLPQTRSSSIHGVESTFRPDGMKLFKNIRIFGWVVLPQTRSNSIHSVEEPFRLSVMQPFKNFQVDGWAALPNYFCHGPARFTAFNNVFFLMLCRLSTTFKWTAGRAPPNTFQLISRCWVNFSSGWREVFQKHSNFRLVRAPPNTAQFLTRC